jgi:D-alanyl-D-alanine carboxypeptidase
MKQRFWLLWIVTTLFLVACAGQTEDAVDSVESTPTVALIETTVPTPEPVLFSAENLVGIWRGSVAGETGYVMYTPAGQYTVALTRDTLATAPRVTGEYWVEAGQVHLRDVDNAGHWIACDAETVGIYNVATSDSGQLRFETVDDACSEGGFTRNYIFANMLQERIGDAVEIVPPETERNADALPELAAALQTIADTWVAENGVPAFTLLVDAPDLNFKWKGAAGMANPDAGVPMGVDDPFIISSVTKMYTAVAVMQLVEQGKIDLDAPIDRYLAEELVASLQTENVTVRQLLSHTSGLGDFSNGVDANANGLSDFKELVLAEPDTLWNEDAVLAWAAANAPAVGEPDEMFNYSDTNYQLLGKIVEAASGLTLHETLRQQIFEPVGMTHTYFEFREDPVSDVALSNAYYNGTLWNDLDSRSYEWGSGGLVSTVEDQNRFLWAWVNGDLFAAESSKAAMLDWVEAPGCGAYYGFGVWRFIYDECDLPGLGENVGHGGLFNSHAHYWPEQNITIVGTLNANAPELGFIGVMIETMYTLLEFVE